MSQYSPQGFSMLPTGVKNLLIVNILFYLATIVMDRAMGISLDDYLALYCVQSSNFHIWQYVTYMFMHANIDHIFFNMFALWMFGYVLENIWGTQRFLLYYMVCGLGAGLVHTLITGANCYLLQEAVNGYALSPDPDAFVQLLHRRFEGSYNPTVVAQFVDAWRVSGGLGDYGAQSVAMAQQLLDFKASIPTVGASGAVYGILLAFGMMFPNERIYLYFLVPLKAKWFVIGYGVLELVLGVFHSADGIAHFAHLGGMLFGLLFILYWRKKSLNRWN